MTKNFVGLSVVFFLAFVSFASARSSPPRPPGGEDILVGHISYVEGQLLRYVSEENDWVATVKEAPFSLDDALYSAEDSRAEFIIPNDTWIRTGGSTQIQLIALKQDVTEADMASGVARFYNRSENGVIKVTTEYGYVIADRETTFDLYVGDESIEVVTLKGKVDFVHAGNQKRYDVISGSSIVADGNQVTSNEANVDAEWDDWNMDRDRTWQKWQQAAGDSGRYLPPTLRDEAYVLQENGRWEEVRYQGANRRVWRPTSVSTGWSPFTLGRWADYHGDNTWIPDEQFGYVTHHYGNWIYAGNVWYWAPPVARVQVGIGPFLAVGLGWYPGRVGWIHTGITIGWVPLAWNENYYSHRRWGSRTTVINTTNINQINIDIGNYRYLDRAIVVNRDTLYSARNYRDVRLANISGETITRDYRAAAIVDNRMIDKYKTIRERHNFANIDVGRKPHEVVRERILQNEKLSRQARKVSSSAFLQNVRKSKSGRVDRDVSITQPKVGNKLVGLGEVSNPRSAGDFHQKPLKNTIRQIQPVHIATVQSGKGPEKQGRAIRPEKAEKKSSRPGQAKMSKTAGAINRVDKSHIKKGINEPQLSQSAKKSIDYSMHRRTKIQGDDHEKS